MPSGIMQREQWQLLPIHAGGGVGGSRSGVGYDIVPRGSATRNRLAGENGKKIDWCIVYDAHTSRIEFIEHELRGFAQKVLLTCVCVSAPTYVYMYMCV